jgi:hypothetical protein
MEDHAMDTPINRSRILKARQSVKEALDELDTALAEAERPRPTNPPTRGIKAAAKHKTMRRVG